MRVGGRSHFWRIGGRLRLTDRGDRGFWELRAIAFLRTWGRSHLMRVGGRSRFLGIWRRSRFLGVEGDRAVGDLGAIALSKGWRAIAFWG